MRVKLIEGCSKLTAKGPQSLLRVARDGCWRVVTNGRFGDHACPFHQRGGRAPLPGWSKADETMPWSVFS